jgi:TRAP-type C4-dicarboxylate transport system permease small subunit
MIRLDSYIKAIERAFVFVAGLGLLTVMLVIVIDVVMRYLFSAPLSWSYDLVSLYLVTLVFFMALADTFRRGDHIKVDLFEGLRGTRLLAVTEIVGYCLALLFFALILQQMVINGVEAFEANDVLDGAIPWPTWPPYAIGTLGVGLLILRVLLSTVGRVAALLAGRTYLQEGADRPDRHPGGGAE